MAVDKVREALEQARDDITAFAANPDDESRKGVVRVPEAAVRGAHKSVYERGIDESDKHGMGTTLDVVLVAGPEAFVAHVGDSRTYLIRDRRAAQITTDHTVAEVLVIEGKLSPEEAQVSPLRTILVNAIGVAPEVGIEMAHVQLRLGDQLLVCSDGLHDYFPHDQELADHVSSYTPEKALAELVSLAKERGGHDNITGIVIRVKRCDAQSSIDDGRVIEPLDGDISDGIPASIERDDTLPVDLGDEPPARDKLLNRKKQLEGASALESAASPARKSPAAQSIELEETLEPGQVAAAQDDPSMRVTEPIRTVSPPAAAEADPEFDAEKTLD
jgi:protein phosphatase